MKRLVLLLVAWVATMLTLTTAGPASAATYPSCNGANTSTPSGTCADVVTWSGSNPGFVDYTESSAYAPVGTGGKTLLAYNLVNGITPTNAELWNCPYVSHPWQVTSRMICVRARRGFTFIDSGRNTAGGYTKFQNSVGNAASITPTAGWIRFVKPGAQWYEAADNYGKGNTGNRVWFTGTKPSLTTSGVILIRSFATWTFTGHVTVSAHPWATANANSWCTNSNGTNTFFGSGDGSASLTKANSYRAVGLTTIKADIANFVTAVRRQAQAAADTQAINQAVANIGPVTCP